MIVQKCSSIGLLTILSALPRQEWCMCSAGPNHRQTYHHGIAPREGEDGGRLTAPRRRADSHQSELASQPELACLHPRGTRNRGRKPIGLNQRLKPGATE